MKRLIVHKKTFLHRIQAPNKLMFGQPFVFSLKKRSEKWTNRDFFFAVNYEESLANLNNETAIQVSRRYIIYVDEVWGRHVYSYSNIFRETHDTYYNLRIKNQELGFGLNLFGLARN